MQRVLGDILEKDNERGREASWKKERRFLKLREEPERGFKR